MEKEFELKEKESEIIEKELIQSKLQSKIVSFNVIGGGRNSKVYKVECDGNINYVAKFYSKPSSGQRDRLKTEFESFQFLWNQGVRSVPQPISCNVENDYGIYNFIEGNKISGNEITSVDIDYTVQFLLKLRDLGGKSGSENIASAADACFSIQNIIDIIERRLNRLKNILGGDYHEDYHSVKLHQFLNEEFLPSYHKIKEWCEMYLEKEGMSLSAELNLAQRTLSPSDFGFHNAIKQNDGKIVFFDFEYFGWDDPAKMISDFLLHPGMKLSEEHKQRFVSGIMQGMQNDVALMKRLKVFYPLLGLNWCLLLLNEFVPEHFQRRNFANSDTYNETYSKGEQLLKAQQMLQKVQQEYESFLYSGVENNQLNDNSKQLDNRSKHLRKVIIETMEKGGRGHPASAFSLVEILRVLYDDIMKYDSQNPNWSLRDRFILSKGHGCLALYVILAEKGFFPNSELWNFCKSDGLLGGHPEHKIPGVEVSTGSLGHGLPMGIGFALNAKYEKSSQRTFVVIGDGESNEGSIWEAALCAGKHKLSNLTVLVDYNKHQSYGSTYEVQDLEPFADKWKSFGFEVKEVDGHDVEELKSVLSKLPLHQEKPTCIICHTIKGKGVSFMENNLLWHHKSRLKEEEISSLYREIDEA